MFIETQEHHKKKKKYTNNKKRRIKYQRRKSTVRFKNLTRDKRRCISSSATRRPNKTKNAQEI